jgi:hypothetical protein
LAEIHSIEFYLVKKKQEMKMEKNNTFMFISLAKKRNCIEFLSLAVECFLSPYCPGIRVLLLIT